MAKKAELLEQAKALGLEVTDKNTIAELETAIASADTATEEVVVAGETVQTAEVAAEDAPEEKTTKAGKRSAKGQKEAEEKAAKLERQAHADEEKEESKPKVVQKVRSRLERRSKSYRKVAQQIEKGKTYSLIEALDLATKTNPVKFDATVEVHVRLGVDPRQADQNIRDTIILPAGTGKTVRVAVFAEGDDVAKAQKAGADIAAADEFLQQLDKGVIDFDVLVATPKVMAKLGKYARVLGPKGLMPNPKSGTVAADVAKAVTEAKAGRVEYRVDSTGIVHLGVGKVSFGPEKLNKNVRALLDSIKSNKPGSVKGTYVQSVYVTTTMGPSITIATSEVN
jgi:ribosomal protein L1